MFDDKEKAERAILLGRRYQEGYFAGQRAKLSNETYLQGAAKQDSFTGMYGFWCGFYTKPYDTEWM